MTGREQSRASKLAKSPTRSNGSIYLLKAFCLGLSDALGPDSSLRRVMFLLVLWEAGIDGITATELEKRMEGLVGAAQSTTSRSVRVLTESGLVESYLDSCDPRVRLVRLTGVARALLKSLADTAFR
jgi:DNA-binding MarR family transcriptional regulator